MDSGGSSIRSRRHQTGSLQARGTKWLSESLIHSPTLTAGKHHCSDDSNDEQHRGQLKRKDIVAVQAAGQFANVVISRDTGVDPLTQRRASSHNCSGDEATDGNTNDHSERPLNLEWFDGEIFCAVNTEQHDDEEEQHHDGPCVDNDLYGREKVGFHRHEVHGYSEQCENKTKSSMNRIAVRNNTNSPSQHHH